MRYLLFIFVLLVCHLASTAQSVSSKPSRPKVHTYVEKPASYPNDKRAPFSYMAREALFTYIAQNFKNEAALTAVTAYSTALYTLTINPEGQIDTVTILTSVSPAIDQEFIRVLKSIPAWVPAEYDGKKVHSLLTIPLVVNAYNPTYRKDQIKEYKYFFTMEQMPSFKGGSEELIKALKENFKKLPQPLVKDPGKPLVLHLVINSDGKPILGETQVYNGYSLTVNEKLAEVVHSLPAFNPASHNGYHPIARYTLPIGLNEKGEVIWVHTPPKE